MLGSSVGPCGTAQETSVPLISSRRSKCSRVARCRWTQKLRPTGVTLPGGGSGVRSKRRFFAYSSRGKRIYIVIANGCHAASAAPQWGNAAYLVVDCLSFARRGPHTHAQPSCGNG